VIDSSPLPAGLRDRILRQVEAEPAPTRATVQRRGALVLGGAFALALAVFWYYGGARITERPLWLVLATAGGTGLLALGAIWAAFGRGRSALGRPRVLLAALAVASPLLLVAWKFGISAADGMADEWQPRLGLKCLTLSLKTGLFPLLAFVMARRGSDPVHPFALGTALGAAAGTFAAMLTDLWCPVAYMPHLLLGHVLPLVSLTALGAGLGWFLRPR
jgi:hypothetical protein